MFSLNFDYASCIANSEKIAWKIDEVMPVGTDLDFSRPFLPEELVMLGAIECLNADEKRQLNQIVGNAYLNLFGFVEEYILATVVQHANAEMFGDRVAVRALCRFAEEEVKHQQLFDRYREAFNRGFGQDCGVLDSAVDVAQVIMSKSPVAVMVLTLHIELMTQQHYTECIKDNTNVDPFFASLLKYHWLDEAQHAKIDALELEKLVEMATKEEIEKSVDEYLEILTAFDGLLRAQGDMDIVSLEGKTGRSFTDAEKAEIMKGLITSYRKTFIIYGMTNPGFVKIMGKMTKDGQTRIADTVTAYN
ncbi:diiron oxygenase [Haliangium ochraceum]|uniref:Uncharacterized protein n=1 Tax=Haliangium ochraceum (strain DSM 14365 / JCM 11303 / SMP-2) TaxID=502025 RepID=D0LFQ1_HALO1|nr:diiron oxygenase [Haliangium ochraceum]ACY12685.1 conserved hypothetical protein [Haliangium ochraceum DSM 14365]